MEAHTFFIVPYRDRSKDLVNFMSYYENLVSHTGEWGKGIELLVVEQADSRPFCRGALKNIGAMHAASRSHSNPVLVFHDVDTLPRYPLRIDYGCSEGVVNHIYGNNEALGGIVSIRLRDFIRIGGFPNIWGWGYEDNVLTARAGKGGLSIDRARKIRLTDYSRIIRLDIKSCPPTRDISIDSLKRVRLGQCDGYNDLKGITVEIAGAFLRVRAFETRYPSPQRLITLSAKLLRGNVMQALFPETKRYRMNYA